MRFRIRGRERDSDEVVELDVEATNSLEALESIRSQGVEPFGIIGIAPHEPPRAGGPGAALWVFGGAALIAATALLVWTLFPAPASAPDRAPDHAPDHAAQADAPPPSAAGE